MAFPAPSTDRDRFRAAYRLVRVAFPRGLKREALKADLQVAPDYTMTCRRSNAGVKVVTKVMAALGRTDDLTITVMTAAVKLALGQPHTRQRGMPGRLDFEGWMAQREWWAMVQRGEWTSDVRKAA